MVPDRIQQQQLAEGARRHHLGRMGARGRRSRTGVRRAVAQLANARRRPCRPDPASRGHAALQPGFAPHHRERLERGRALQDGADALPRLLPVLRGAAAGRGRARQAELPALPAQRRHLPGRALQHRELCASHAHAGAAVRPRGGRLHLDRRRLPHLQQPRGAGRAAARPLALSLPRARHQAPAGIDLRIRVRGFRGARLPASSVDQGAGRGLSP
ncbi:hypothetical protein VARIO8X_100083 [Burkholderiales bacterium 8X]|nr:hypothetical protein VARIO8X_100083 [Burkholderiales bacterium 8X]